MWSFHAALVARGSGGNIAGINGGTAEHRHVGVGRAAVIPQRSEQGIDTRQVARLVQTAGAVAVEVKASGDKFAGPRKAVAIVWKKPRLPRNDCVIQRDPAGLRPNAASLTLTLVVGNGRIEEVHKPASVEDAAAEAAVTDSRIQRGVAADGRVDDRDRCTAVVIKSTAKRGPIVADGDTQQCQIVSVVYPSTGIVTTDQEFIPVPNRQVANFNRASRDVKNAQIEVPRVSTDRDPSLVLADDAQGLSTNNSPLVSMMSPSTSNPIVPLTGTSAIACRRDPGPESARLVTRISGTSGEAGVATANNKAIRERIMSFIASFLIDARHFLA